MGEVRIPLRVRPSEIVDHTFASEMQTTHVESAPEAEVRAWLHQIPTAVPLTVAHAAA